MASWVDVQAGRLVARSNWDRYTPRVRMVWAVVCWLVGLTATLIVLVILNADVLFSVVWTVAVQSWLAILLAANVRKSKGREGDHLGRPRFGVPSDSSGARLNRGRRITSTPCLTRGAACLLSAPPPSNVRGERRMSRSLPPVYGRVVVRTIGEG